MTTRQQRYLTMALDHVGDVKKQTGKDETHRIYGGLCHSFPVLVRACGLCQALAFVEEKAGRENSRGKAYLFLREHVAAQLGLKEPARLLEVVGGKETTTAAYMRHTRTVLAAWVYYKRFAVSILAVESASNGEDPT